MAKMKAVQVPKAGADFEICGGRNPAAAPGHVRIAGAGLPVFVIAMCYERGRVAGDCVSAGAGARSRGRD